MGAYGKWLGRAIQLVSLLVWAGTAWGQGGQGAGSPETFFLGAMTPTPPCVGLCPNSLTLIGITSGGAPITFTATGFSDAFTTPSPLTFKPLTFPGELETGLEENAAGAVALVSAKPFVNTPAAPALIISSNENFNIFEGSSIGTLTEVKFTDTCSVSGGTCSVILPEPALAVGVQSAGSGDVVLTAVTAQTTSVPEPATLSLLGVALVAIGVARRRRT